MNFPGDQKPPLGGLHVICDAHFWTWPSYFSQKSCVKIWFGLVEAFKRYRGKKKKKKMKTSKNARLWSARRVLTIVESIWKSGILPYLVANRSGLRGVHNVFGDSFCRTVWGVCLDLVHFFFFFPLAVKLRGLRTGCQFFKNCRVSH